VVIIRIIAGPWAATQFGPSISGPAALERTRTDSRSLHLDPSPYSYDVSDPT
jgi:hypothetical protein